MLSAIADLGWVGIGLLVVTIVAVFQLPRTNFTSEARSIQGFSILYISVCVFLFGAISLWFVKIVLVWGIILAVFQQRRTNLKPEAQLILGVYTLFISVNTVLYGTAVNLAHMGGVDLDRSIERFGTFCYSIPAIVVVGVLFIGGNFAIDTACEMVRFKLKGLVPAKRRLSICYLNVVLYSITLFVVLKFVRAIVVQWLPHLSGNYIMPDAWHAELFNTNTLAYWVIIFLAYFVHCWAIGGWLKISRRTIVLWYVTACFGAFAFWMAAMLAVKFGWIGALPHFNPNLMPVNMVVFLLAIALGMIYCCVRLVRHLSLLPGRFKR